MTSKWPKGDKGGLSKKPNEVVGRKEDRVAVADK